MLVREEKSLGVVKVESCSDGLAAEITMDGEALPDENSVFKAYLSLPGRNENRYLGVLEGCRGRFVLKDTVAPVGIVITVKDTLTGKEEFYCLCAEEGKLEAVKNCFKRPETAEKEASEDSSIETEKVAFEREYMKRAEDKLKELFKDFSFEKISGYYLRSNSRIVEYIMGGNGVYRNIMTYGHYYYATADVEEGVEFLLAVPGKQNEDIPFENCSEYVFVVDSMGPDDDIYYCVRAGKDKNGEYFCRKK